MRFNDYNYVLSPERTKETVKHLFVSYAFAKKLLEASVSNIKGILQSFK
jgi:hypothetical protein